MNKNKPNIGENFTGVNRFQSNRQNQHMSNNNSNSSSQSFNRTNNNRQSNNNSNNYGNRKSSFNDGNNNRNVSGNSHGINTRTKTRGRVDQRAPNRFNRNEHNNNNNDNNNNGYGNRNTNINTGSSKPIRRKNIPIKSTGLKKSSMIAPATSRPPISSTTIPSQSTTTRHHPAKSDKNSFEIKYYGSLLRNPESYGFQKIPQKNHVVPKYLLKENVLFDMSTFTKNEWDIKNQQMLLNREASFSGEPQLLFEEFQEHRKIERNMMEKLNLVDKENAKKSLDDAIVFRGSCEDMCPTYERVERVYKNQVSKWEKDPSTNKISRHLALKTFMRPSGQAPSLPSDVRSPDVLQKSLNHIIENLLPHLPESQSFIWDRTRSIRQDFTFQNNYSGFESIDCHEKICRIHILSLHVMAGANDPDYQQQQEVEQFNNSLQTLTHMYDDVRSRGGFCPNEPEFRAYELISKIKDAELDRYLQSLPNYILDNQFVQRAMMLRNLVFEGLGNLNLFTEFFKMVLDKNKTPFLLASIAEIHFNEIRYNAIRAMSRFYHPKSKKMPSAYELVSMLGYNDVDQLLATCKIYALPVYNDTETNTIRVNVTELKSAFKLSQKQAYTKGIDNMINGMTMSAIINSGIINTDLNLKRPQALEEVARESFKAGKQNSENVEKVLRENNMKLSQPKVSTLSTVSNATLPFANNGGNISGISNNLFSASNNNTSGQSVLPSTNLLSNPTNNLETNFFENENSLEIPNKTTTAEKTFGNLVPISSTTVLPGSLQTPPKNIFANSAKNSKNVPINETEARDVGTKPEAPVSEPIVIQPPLPLPNKLVDNLLFNNEASKIVDEMVVKSVKELAGKIVQEQLDKEVQRRKEKQKTNLVKKMTDELFTAFMKEQIYLAAQEGRANYVYHKNLKLRVIQGLIRKAKKVYQKNQVLKAKKTEIAKFNNGVVSSVVLPKVPIIQKSAIVKPAKFNLIKSDLSKTFNDANPSYDLNGSIILRSSRSIASEWLLNQLGMKNSSTNIKINGSNGYILRFGMLPDSFDTKEYFKNISSVIIQVGTIEGIDKPDKYSLVKCLIRDSKVLHKLKSYLNEYSSSSCFSVVVVYVDSFKINLSFNEIKQLLKLEELSTSRITVGFFKMNTSLLLATNGLSLLQKLQSGFNKILANVWKKMYLRSNNELTRTSESINIIDKDTTGSESINSATVCSSSSGMLKPKTTSSSIKKRINYLHDVIASSKSKRRKYSSNLSSRDLSLLMNSSKNNLQINASDSNISILAKQDNNLGMKGYNNSLMMLRNYNFSTLDSRNTTSFLDDARAKKKIDELSELDKLADSILNN